MPQIITKAGAFELECWTDGHPLWVKLKINGARIENGSTVEGVHLTVDDLHDLIHAAKRMIDKAAPLAR